MFNVSATLKCVVTEVALFSIVAFKILDISQGSVATQLRYGGIFIAIYIPLPHRIEYDSVSDRQPVIVFSGLVVCR